MAGKKIATTEAAETKTVKKTTRKTAAAATTKKTEEKKPTTRKTAAKKAVEPNTEVFVQFWGKEVVTSDVVNAVKKVWVEEMGKTAEEMQDLKIYIKPEDNGAHYVINGEITGFVAL